MNSTTDQAHVCPDCNSPFVDFSMLSDEGARCNACGWSGRVSEMIATPFVHEMGSDVMSHFLNDFRTTISKHFALPFGVLLHKWGFLPEGQKEKVQMLTRYLTVAGRATVKAVLEERALIEKEKVNESSGRKT